MTPVVSGFSKLSKADKIKWIAEYHFNNDVNAIDTLTKYWNSNEKLQKLHDEFTENTISNYYLPFSVAPNFLINGERYTLPMTIEESSVVAAASKAAKFWQTRGGFRAEVISTTKVGQVHFTYAGNVEKLEHFFSTINKKLINSVAHITKNMEKRGGGVKKIELRNKSTDIDNYYQLHCTFETADAMGANFINSCLEQFAKTLLSEAQSYSEFNDDEKEIEIIMSILSNYVPQCIVRASVSCPVSELPNTSKLSSLHYAKKFIRAVRIAEVEPYRAVTHNKGIMNGIDAVVLATGNDFRAIEAGAHAYASRKGSYASLTAATIKDDVFTFSIEIPLALGTVGGLTNLHPLVKLALQLLGSPNAKKLMEITAVAGLAQNFAAINSLITTGIQQGHMKMHLMNILNQFEATKSEKEQLIEYFKTNTVTHSDVVTQIERLRN
ncbi:hydroxymethylglutaryl-CoA reductase, degradative [Aquimarina sp. AD10]|uniref:3-hydroxy-3-methylglutaryl coenzyme A reductase n=1 Tax=Aquimarina aggregata TaxID=1642818 RepID=A0A162YWB9_9FLAO|nr:MULTISPECIES: hydroxymethylglutaryl-CoA reductase, degradative [Aquimarina]AXT61307.1 hydroxymethylglutaryl-CoA reductase, degradative [Aquimarina sp. AD10]KZS39402.1 hydroxymethylglutaryl-CoA reductase [Aquimarina aggregata]RKN01499.1 hydroxymethylglutaryl-CoA reductase, degradative [Aquimarina sp. AD10]